MSRRYVIPTTILAAAATGGVIGALSKAGQDGEINRLESGIEAVAECADGQRPLTTDPTTNVVVCGGYFVELSISQTETGHSRIEPDFAATTDNLTASIEDQDE